jgi:hypothetical protein
VISFWTTFFLMFVVFLVLGKEVFFVSGQRYYAPAKEKYGPLGVFFFAALLIMTDPSVHMMGDLGWWRWCGNNPQFNRINSTNSWPSQCAGSSTHYVCTIGCCVSTWQNTSNEKGTSYAWTPPSADFSPGGPIPGSFLTLRPDGTVYQAPGTTGPFQLFSATTQQPLAFFETGEVNPLKGGYTAADCPKYGVNPITGYCYMTDVTLPYEEQLAQLGEYGMALADPSQPFNMTTNNYVCGCDGCTPTEDFAHLSVVGVLSAIVCTYVGFTLLAVAVGWNANIHKKLKKFKEQWNKLRGLQKKRAAALSNAEYTAATLP